MGEIKQEINWRFVADSLMALANDSGELEAVKAERDRLKRHVGDLILDLNNARFDANVSASERDELADQIGSLRQQLGVEIRAKDEWEQNAEYEQAEREEVEKVLSRLQEDLGSGAIVETPYVPRTITAGELREGQLICIHRWHGWGVRAIGEFQGIEGDVVTIKTGGSGTFTESVKFHTIVLLADEPAKDVCTSTGHVKDRADSLHVTAEDIRNSDPGSTFEDRYGDDWEWNGTKVVCNEVTGNPDGVEPEIALDAHGPFTRSTAAPRGTYSKRLAVADLDAAPVGSVLELENHCPLVRDIHGVWLGEEANYEPMFIHRWSDIWDQATLTPPEKPELPEVPNPGKHPVIMVHSGKDSGLPVREEVAVWDGDDGYMGKGFHLYPEEVRSWSPVRIVVEDGA